MFSSFDDDYSKKLIQFYKFNDEKESIVHKAIALPINTLFQFSLRIPILNLQKA